ncbi:Uncharacterized protein dnm_092820 [Desulfonema magnum]|uniref:Uncharacterized protein n=1 Tax=Desulfonema magnum TaxID=45655 RepID=A0A975BWR3_9BACT|nr:Uncharacterized protein dnm_092820 [Desulfonema magnum]
MFFLSENKSWQQINHNIQRTNYNDRNLVFVYWNLVLVICYFRFIRVRAFIYSDLSP